MPLVGDNVDYMVEQGEILTIMVDLNKEFGKSASGKTIKIASTCGNKAVEGTAIPGVIIGLNVYKYPNKKGG